MLTVSVSEKILVVEDEVAIREMIVMALEMAGFQCIQAGDARTGWQLIIDEQPDLILSDWMLPDQMSGVDLCQRIKQHDATAEKPVILLTARGEEDHKVKGLDAGADDYITKPFSTRELVSRIKAVLRRVNGHLQDKVIDVGGLKLDPKSQRVSFDAKPISIGPTEYRLLHFFMTHIDRAYTREQILDQVWGGNVYVEDRTIDVHIRRLRKVLEPTGCERFIQTVRGTGYRFSMQEEA